jgi:hypothetical protein
VGSLFYGLFIRLYSSENNPQRIRADYRQFINRGFNLRFFFCVISAHYRAVNRAVLGLMGLIAKPATLTARKSAFSQYEKQGIKKFALAHARDNTADKPYR